MTTVATVERLAEAGDWTALVSTCEDAFADEREAWGSSSVVSAEMDARSGRGPSHHSSLNTIAAGETTVGRV